MNTKYKFFTVFCVVLFAALSAFGQEVRFGTEPDPRQQETSRRGGVVLNDEVILRAIQALPNKFDLSATEQVKLQQGGVSDPVLIAMLEAPSAVVAAPKAQAATAVSFFRTADAVVKYAQGKWSVIAEPQYVADGDYDSGDFDGFVVLGVGGIPLDLRGRVGDLGPSIQNELEQKVSRSGIPTRIAATGLDAREMDSAETELETGVDAGKSGRHASWPTATLMFQANWAIAAHKADIRFFNGPEAAGRIDAVADRVGGVFGLPGRVRDGVGIGTEVLGGIIAAKATVRMKFVLYLKVIPTNSLQVVYAEKASTMRTVSAVAFRDILGVGRASRDSLRAAEVSADLVGKVFSWTPAARKEVEELRKEREKLASKP